ncbi:hypothetical protein KIPB_009162, partial [Kipferlia bialata]
YTLLALIVKLADLSNPFRPQAVASVYAECIMREFFRQGEEERDYDHCLVLPNHQDRSQYPSNMNGCQIAFITSLVKPLLKLYSASLDSLAKMHKGPRVTEGESPGSGICSVIRDNMTRNMDHWRSLRDKCERDAQLKRQRERESMDSFSSLTPPLSPQNPLCSSLPVNEDSLSDSIGIEPLDLLKEMSRGAVGCEVHGSSCSSSNTSVDGIERERERDGVIDPNGEGDSASKVPRCDTLPQR